MGMAIMALTGVGLYVFAPALMGIFTADAAVIALGAQVLRIDVYKRQVCCSARCPSSLMTAPCVPHWLRNSRQPWMASSALISAMTFSRSSCAASAGSRYCFTSTPTLPQRVITPRS